MTDLRDTASTESVESTPTVAVPPWRGGISRRALIRGSVAAVPTILTLQSGAALASTSYGVVSGTSIPEGLNGGVGGSSTGACGSSTIDSQYHCLNTGGQKSGTWDLSVSDEVTNITSGQQYTYTPLGSDPTTSKTAYGDEMCRTGATNVGAPGGGTTGTGTVPNGMLLSACAYSSLYASNAITVFPEL